MSKIIEEKFNLGEKQKTYQRIDGEHPIDIFIGYNDNGNMSLAITGKKVTKKIDSTPIVDVSSKKRYDNKVQLVFSLTDISYASLFIHFCEDIIYNAKTTNEDIVLDFLIGRWNYWRKMFKVSGSDILSDFAIKGLIGELIFLSTFMFEKYGVMAAVSSWMGPGMAHKDFEIEDTWYEIKSTDSGSASVKISSLSQLDSDYDGYLVVIMLDKTSPENKKSYSLNTCVFQIISKIQDEVIIEIFLEKLFQVGYTYNLQYDNICYSFKSVNNYIVSEKFPRITSKIVSPGISSVSYNLSLQFINQFIEVEE